MIHIFPSEALFDRASALRIAGQIAEKPDSLIGLSTGRTTGAMHRLVVQICREQAIDTSRICFFGVDEVVGIPPDNPAACAAMLRTEIIGPMGIPDRRFLMLPTCSDDFPAACRAFRAALDRRGGIDLLVLGLGENGHLGFNQPGTPADSRTQHAAIDPDSETRIRARAMLPPDAPLGGITLGLADILEARSLMLVAKGSGKAEIVRKMLLGRVTEAVPASLLRHRPDCDYYFDTQAAAKL